MYKDFKKFTEIFCIYFSKLTTNERFAKVREAVLITRLEFLCHKKGISLAEFFYKLENKEEIIKTKSNITTITDARICFIVLSMIGREKNISDYRICEIYNWDRPNYSHEKSKALDGRRKTFSLIKLYQILYVLEVPFSTFFQRCDEYIEKEKNQKKRKKRKKPNSNTNP